MLEEWEGPRLLEDDLIRENAPELGPFLDVEYRVEVLIGATKRKVREILEFEEGDTIRLDHDASHDIRLTVGDVQLASAEVIRTKEGTAARVTEV